MHLTEQQLERYSRHLVLDQVGQTGQEKLLSSAVLIVGVGGLGSAAGLYLAGAGVGTIGLVDADTVELANLPRQVIHDSDAVGVAKVESARAKIKALNPDVSVKVYQQWARADNMRAMIRDYDFVIDATDNFAGKFLINDACYFEKTAFSHAGALGFQGQLLTVLPGETTCCRCLIEPPTSEEIPSNAEVGVLCTLPGVIGLLQATESLKYLLGIGPLLTNSLLTYNALTMEFRKLSLQRDRDCPLCGTEPRITQLRNQEYQADTPEDK